jgi:hypothetical protein
MIPGLQGVDAEVLTCELPHLDEFALGLWTRAPPEITQELHHLFRRARHLGGQRELGVVGETEQLGMLLAQRQQLDHQGAVVVGRWPEVAGHRVVGAVQLLAQRTIGGVLHHRQPTRRLQAQLAAVAPVGEGIGAQRGAHVIGHAGEVRRVDIERE